MTLFSPQLAARFDALVKKYPLRRSALIPMLLYAQDEIGYLSDVVIAEVAERIGITELEVRNVDVYKRQVRNPPQRSLGLLDAVVERNAYGRQIDSTILTAETALPGGPLEMVFIRAPRIVATGPDVEVLAQRDDSPVLVRQGHVMAATFHPELSNDRRVHRLFVQIVAADPSK